MAEVVPLLATPAVPSDHEQRYRQQLERWYNRLSLTGLPERDPHLNELPLDQIFVTLAVEAPQTHALPDDREAAEGPVLKAAEKLLKDQRSEAGRFLRTPLEQQKLSVGEALHRFRRLVVIGAPGSGKTTLLRWLAVTFAANRQAQPDRLGTAFTEPYLPIVLDLRRFADRFREISEQPETFSLAVEASTYIEKDSRFQTPAPVVRDAIIAGRCLILLDGLDEIADQATRRRVVEAIEALYLDSTQKSAGNLCILSTRPYGFTGLSLGGGFQTVTVRPFEREDVSKFIPNWYHVAYGADALAEEAEELVETVRKNDRVEALALNPLLCTIITIVYRNNRVLPDRRVELYFKCCEALLDTWERNKDIKSSGLIGGLGWQVKLELLAGLAYWMHSETERLAAAEDDIIHQLRDALKADRLVEPEKAEDEARQFIQTIRDRSGLLRGRGDGSLEFSHRTFQEYLAARHLAAMDEEDMIDVVMPHLHEAWWQEVHLLLFGHLGTGKEGSRKIECLTFCILDSSPKPPPFLTPPRSSNSRLFYPGYWFPGWQLQRRISRLLGRDLAFAIRGYCDCAPTARTIGLNDRLQHELQHVLSRWRHEPALMNETFRNLHQATEPGSRCGPLTAGLQMFCLSALKDSKFSARRAAVEALRPGSGNPAVVEALLAVVKGKESEFDVRLTSAIALGSVAARNSAVNEALLANLKDSDLSVQFTSAMALGSFAVRNPAVDEALLAALKDSDAHVRSVVARALGSASAGNPAVVDSLLAALKDGDAGVRSAVAGALGSASAGNPAVVDSLLAALKDGDADVRSAVARALRSASAGNPAVVDSLLAALKDGDAGVRSAAAGALGSASAGNPAVVDSLLAALKDSDATVRLAAAGALGSASAGNSAVVDSLLAALKDSDATVRLAAAAALGSAARGGDITSVQLSRYLQRAFHTINTFPPGVETTVRALGNLTAGRQLPGYRWHSLKARRLRRERWRKLAIGTITGLGIGILLYFGGAWYAELPEHDPRKAFLDAVPAISTLLGLLWALWQVIRGGKKTPWD
jgi:HEAT repeat protein